MKAWRCNTPFGKIRLSIEPPRKCPAYFGDGPHNCIARKGKRRKAAEEIESKKCDAEEVEVLPAAEYEAREAVIEAAIEVLYTTSTPEMFSGGAFQDACKKLTDKIRALDIAVLDAAPAPDGRVAACEHDWVVIRPADTYHRSVETSWCRECGAKRRRCLVCIDHDPAGSTYDFDESQTEIALPCAVPDGRVAELATYLRKEVAEFARAMEDELRKHDAARGATGWKQEPIDYLVERLEEEMTEFRLAVKVASPDVVMSEAADVGNLAMMVSDALAALLGRESNPPSGGGEE